MLHQALVVLCTIRYVLTVPCAVSSYSLCSCIAFCTWPAIGAFLHVTLQCSPWLGGCELHITVQTSHCNCTIGTAYTRRATPLNLTVFCTPTATLLSCTPCCTLIVAHSTDIAPYVHCPFQAPLVLLYQGLSQLMISVQGHRSRVMPQPVESASVSEGRL